MAALRAFLLRFCEAAHARGGIAVPVARALVCAHARGRAIRLEAELASRAALLCAEARARAAQAYLLHAQRQAGAAAVVAGRRLLQAKDFTAYTVLRVAYGNSPPTRRTAEEWLYIFDMCLLRVWNMLRRADKLLNLLEICIAISPHSVGIIIATIYTPIAIPVAEFYKTLLSTAPESCCPFLGIRCVEFDDEFPAGKGLAAVALLCGRIGRVVLLTSGLLCISLCIDMGTIGYSLVEKLFRWNRDAGLAELPSTVAELKNLKSIVLYDQYNPGRYPHGEPSKRAFSYFVLSGGTTVYASLLRLLVLKFKDVLVPASVEVDLSSIEPGTTVTVKWRGKPVFIRRRTHDEIALARSMDVASLHHPQEDAERVKNPEWLVVVGRFGCTCTSLPNSGDFGGWFCPCHGSHYDISGRIRTGPAPFNLELPTYSFLEDNKMLIGSRTPSTSQERRSPRGALTRE